MKLVRVLLFSFTLVLSGSDIVLSQILSDYSDIWSLISHQSSNQVQNEISILSDAIAGLSTKQVLLYDKMVNLSRSADVMNITSRQMQHELESVSDDILNATLQQLTIQRKLSTISQEIDTIDETTDERLNEVVSVLVGMMRNQTLYHTSLQNITHQSARTNFGLLYLSTIAVQAIATIVKNITHVPQELVGMSYKMNDLSTTVSQMQTYVSEMERNLSCPSCHECCSVNSLEDVEYVDSYLYCLFGTEQPRKWCANVRQQVMQSTRSEWILFFDRDYSRVCAYNLHTRANDCSEDTINLPGLVYVCKN